VIERKAAAAERLAEGEGGAGDRAGYAHGGGEAANPFRFAGPKGPVEADDGSRF